MPHGLVLLSRETGVSLATHVWTTTVASQTLIAAPGTGRALRLHYIAVHQSAAAGLLHLSNNTTAAAANWTYNAAGPHTEESLITMAENEPISLHMAATGGAGFIRVYYSIVPLNGS